MKDWSFDGFASEFDSHVREQLPWYELVTESVAYIARNYLPNNGLVYDIGCSIGNVSKALLPLIEERKATIHAMDNEFSMIDAYRTNVVSNRVLPLFADASIHVYNKFDVAIVMLTAMFLPVKNQQKFLQNLYDQMNEGGAIIIVDKVCDDNGYFSTVMKRLTMYWKLKNGANPKDIINKELSLSGVQRPLDADLLRCFGAKQFFQLGEFKGWVIEK